MLLLQVHLEILLIIQTKSYALYDLLIEAERKEEEGRGRKRKEEERAFFVFVEQIIAFKEVTLTVRQVETNFPGSTFYVFRKQILIFQGEGLIFLASKQQIPILTGAQFYFAE